MDEKDNQMPLFEDNPDNVSDHGNQDQNDLDLLISTTIEKKDTNSFIDSFEDLKRNCIDKNECVKNIYQRWIRLYMDSGFDDEKKTIFKDISFTISNDGLCYFCSKNHCPSGKKMSKSLKKVKKGNGKIVKFIDLVYNTCSCSNLNHEPIDSSQTAKTSNINPTKSYLEDQIVSEIIESYKTSNDFDELCNKSKQYQNDPKKILKIFNGIFYASVLKYLNSESENINLQDGLKFFKEFKVLERGPNSELKTTALLTFYLLFLINTNFHIFLVRGKERKMLYELSPSDFLFYSYAKKKKNFLKNNFINVFFEKGISRDYLCQFFCQIIKKSQKDNEKVNFFFENCFLTNSSLKCDENKSKTFELEFSYDSLNAAYLLNDTNLIEIFDDFMENRIDQIKSDSLYIN